MKKIVVVIVSLLLIFTLAGCSSGGKYIAKVDDTKITQEQLDKRVQRIKAVYEKQGNKLDDKFLKVQEKTELQSLIQEVIIEKELDRLKIKPSDKDIQSRIETNKKAYGTKEQFQNALKSMNLTEKDYEEWIKKQIYYQTLFTNVTKDVKVSETDVRKFFEQNKALFKNTPKPGEKNTEPEPVYENVKSRARQMYEAKVKNETMMKALEDAKKRYKIINKLEDESNKNNTKTETKSTTKK